MWDIKPTLDFIMFLRAISQMIYNSALSIHDFFKCQHRDMEWISHNHLLTLN